MAAVCADVERRAPREQVAGVMRATFLHAFRRDAVYLEQAGDAVLGGPPEAEWGASFIQFVTLMALTQDKGRSKLVELYQRARMPEIMRRIGCGLRLGKSDAPATGSGLPRVAIVSPQLSRAKQPLTFLALVHAHLLARAGCQVGIFSAQEQSIAEVEMRSGCAARFDDPDPDFAQWSQLLYGQTPVHLGLRKVPLDLRLNEALEGIAAFRPDVVLFVGFMSPLMLPLFDAYPVVNLPTHSLPAIAPCDVWLAAAPDASTQICPWPEDFSFGEAMRYPYRMIEFAVGQPMSRAELGIDGQACLLVSVGFRLHQEIHGEWAERMLGMLRMFPKVEWLLVGSDMPPALKGKHPGIKCVPATNRLRALYELSDIVVNPPRPGGGLSIVEAMSAARPVVSHADGDGGAKLGPAAVPDDDAFFGKLGALIGDSAMRRREGAEMRRLFDAELNLAHATPALLAALERARQRFAQRRAGRSV